MVLRWSSLGMPAADGPQSADGEPLNHQFTGLISQYCNSHSSPCPGKAKYIRARIQLCLSQVTIH